MVSEFVFDAAAMLHLGEPKNETSPGPGEFAIRVGGWSLKDLRVSVGHNLMWTDPWYDSHDWANARLTPGSYRVRVPVPDSCSKTFSEQRCLLVEETVAPVALAVTALLCYLTQMGFNMLNEDWIRCAETLPDGCNVTVSVYKGRVKISNVSAESRSEGVWLAGCRFLNPIR